MESLNKVKLYGIVNWCSYIYHENLKRELLHFILHTTRGNFLCILDGNTKLHTHEEVKVSGYYILNTYNDGYESYSKEAICCKNVQEISKTERLKLECSKQEALPINYVNTVELLGLVEKINHNTTETPTTKMLLLVKSSNENTDKALKIKPQRFVCVSNKAVDFNEGDEVRIIGELKTVASTSIKETKNTVEILCKSCTKFYRVNYTSTMYDGIHYKTVEAESLQEAKQKIASLCWHLKDVISIN